MSRHVVPFELWVLIADLLMHVGWLVDIRLESRLSGDKEIHYRQVCRKLRHALEHPGSLVSGANKVGPFSQIRYGAILDALVILDIDPDDDEWRDDAYADQLDLAKRARQWVEGCAPIPGAVLA